MDLATEYLTKETFLRKVQVLFVLISTLI